MRVGDGFAVVADLVSALAMRAEEEAKRAREQLTVTQEEIGTAVDAVEKVDGALSTIVDDVREVHALLTSMVEDGGAQAGAVQEIAEAVQSIDRGMQKNAAMVEESSAASNSLRTEISALVGKAAQFRVDGAGSSETGTAPAFLASMASAGTQPAFAQA